jgi:hypothetical protein
MSNTLYLTKLEELLQLTHPNSIENIKELINNNQVNEASKVLKKLINKEKIKERNRAYYLKQKEKNEVKI